jgi:hypothetical protein
MSNRDTLLATIASLGSKQLREELAARVEIWAEDDPELHEPGETFDEADAFVDLDDLAECEPNWRSFRSECRTILIAAGFYRVISEEEIARTYTSSGNAYAFKHRGAKYWADDAMCTWLEL